MQSFFEAEGFAVVSASSNVVVKLISIVIRVIRSIVMLRTAKIAKFYSAGTARDRETAASSSRMNRHAEAAIPNEMS